MTPFSEAKIIPYHLTTSMRSTLSHFTPITMFGIILAEFQRGSARRAVSHVVAPWGGYCKNSVTNRAMILGRLRPTLEESLSWGVLGLSLQRWSVSAQGFLGSEIPWLRNFSTEEFLGSGFLGIQGWWVSREQKRHIKLLHIKLCPVGPVTGPPSRVSGQKDVCSLGSEDST